MLRACLIVAVAGCRQVAGLDDPLVADASDNCYGTGFVHVCLDVSPTTPVTLDAVTDASSSVCSTHVISGGDNLCVIAGTSVTVPSGQRALLTGSTANVPIIVIATSTISIAGTLDAAGHVGSTSLPAGGGFDGCINGTDPTSGTYGGGGQGGSFLDEGGNGGAGGTQSGGIAGESIATPTTLHGGCPGRAGGNAGGLGGAGGGAIYLIARTSITIAGRVDVSGAGGGGAIGTGGGGAGGSGGTVGLQAPTVAIAGAVCAIGGSGGAGSTGAASQDGGDAGGGASACTPGAAGIATAGGGDGGPGTTNGMGVAGSSGATGGGGGGGGSTGYIKVDGTQTGSGDVEPPA